MKRKLLTSLWTLICFFTLFLTGCSQEDLPTVPVEDPTQFPFRYSEAKYNSDNTYYLLNDREAPEIYFDQKERSFNVNRPLQVSVTDDLYFQLRFYCPRAITNVTIWAKIAGIDEEIRLIELEKVMPLQQLRILLPFATLEMKAITRSGKNIVIPANPELKSTDISLQIECDNPVYKMMTSALPQWKIWFGKYAGSNWGEFKPIHAREAVALALNLATMFSSSEFEAELESYRGKLINNGATVDVDKLKEQPRKHSGFCFGRVVNVVGLGGGNTLGIAEYAYLGMYADDGGSSDVPFHEIGHCMGYGHNGNMTYDNQQNPGWVTLCQKVFRELGSQKRLPIYSRRFLSSRKSKELLEVKSLYGYSWHPFENDPELDALDGGLTPLKGTTDQGGNDGDAVSFKLDYTVVHQATAATFRPKDVYVYGDTLYVVNDADKNYSLEVFSLSKENAPRRLSSINSWNRNNAPVGFEGKPNSVTRSNGKIYVTHELSRTEIFDAHTHQYITCIGNGKWGTNGNQTVHAYDVVLYKGVILIHDKRQLALAEERYVDNEETVYIYTRSENLGEAFGTYGMAVNEEQLYTTHQSGKRIDIFSLSDLREGVTLKRTHTLTYKNNPFALDFYKGRLFVTSNGKEKFCEVNPKTGEIIKDYTTIGGITLQAPEKFCIRRNTLFIVDRVSAGSCVYAIPMNEL